MYRRRPSWSPVHRTGRRCRRPLPARRPWSYSLRMPRRHCNLLPCHSQGQDCRSRKAVYPPAPQRQRCPHCQRLNHRRFQPQRHFAHPFRRRRLNWNHCPSSIHRQCRSRCRASAGLHHYHRHSRPTSGSSRLSRRRHPMSLHRTSHHRSSRRHRMIRRHSNRRHRMIRRHANRRHRMIRRHSSRRRMSLHQTYRHWQAQNCPARAG